MPKRAGYGKLTDLVSRDGVADGDFVVPAF